MFERRHLKQCKMFHVKQWILEGLKMRHLYYVVFPKSQAMNREQMASEGRDRTECCLYKEEYEKGKICICQKEVTIHEEKEI